MCFKSEWLQREHHIRWATSPSFQAKIICHWDFLPFYLKRCLQIFLRSRSQQSLRWLTHIKFIKSLLTFICWRFDEDFSIFFSPLSASWWRLLRGLGGSAGVARATEFGGGMPAGWGLSRWFRSHRVIPSIFQVTKRVNGLTINMRFWDL